MNPTSHTPARPSGLRFALSAISLAVVAALAACASTPAPREEMAVGKAAVERASASAGADAAVELASARDKIARANTAYANRDYDLARRLAQEAEAEASLAEARARAVRSQVALDEVRASIRALRAQMDSAS